jgi:molybdopterin/thiamine biosynthesis adenylyltransferase
MDHTRHIGIFNAANWSVTLIGAGGIGAMTAVALAKMGIGDLVVYDGDIVEPVNIPVQFHKLSDIGKDKAKAIYDTIKEYADDVRLDWIAERVTASTVLEPASIIISAVDSIKARKEIWTAVQTSFRNSHAPICYLDARMSAEYFQLNVVDMKHTRWYEETLALQNDEDIPDDPCTSKATIYTGCIAAGQIGATVRRLITEDQAPGILTHDILKNILNFLPM